MNRLCQEIRLSKKSKWWLAVLTLAPLGALFAFAAVTMWGLHLNWYVVEIAFYEEMVADRDIQPGWEYHLSLVVYSAMALSLLWMLSQLLEHRPRHISDPLT